MGHRRRNESCFLAIRCALCRGNSCYENKVTRPQHILYVELRFNRHEMVLLDYYLNLATILALNQRDFVTGDPKP